MADFDLILSYVPKNEHIDWDGLFKTSLKPIFDDMRKTPQSKLYHAEGDVFEHTRLVCEALVKQEEYKSESDTVRAILFLSALLHDIGKIRCTRLENDSYTSPRHAVVGANMARELLWQGYGLCGTYEKQQMRECICTYIRYHSFPPHAINDENGEKKLLKIASNGEILKDFTIARLCLLERADILGRISINESDYLERVALCVEMARDTGTLNGPYSFKSDFSKRAYFRDMTNYRDDELFDSSALEVIMLCGLPASGKDTYIAKNYPDLPVVSLDDIRKELDILPTQNQGRVLSRATEIMREYLRKRQPFVYNATNIDTQQRAPKISLCEEYGARVKIVFLETAWDELLLRNSKRSAYVPRDVIDRMLSRIDPPEVYEAQSVLWVMPYRSDTN